LHSACQGTAHLLLPVSYATVLTSSASIPPQANDQSYHSACHLVVCMMLQKRFLLQSSRFQFQRWLFCLFGNYHFAVFNQSFNCADFEIRQNFSLNLEHQNNRNPACTRPSIHYNFLF